MRRAQSPSSPRLSRVPKSPRAAERLRRNIQVLVLLTACLIQAGTAAAATASESWPTPAEASDFRSTPSYGQTLGFLREIAARSPYVHLTTFGRSAAGRPLPLVIVSRDGAFEPAAARTLGKPIVLIQNGIHSGEIDGKDACLILLRDLASGHRPKLGEGMTLLIVPIYNVDAHERTSPHNRPNQNGPVEGMGFRTTPAGYDLNRDHLKVESVEARALVGLVNAWRPHLHVDNHVTNGSDHDWVLTWSWVEAPQIDPEVGAWLGRHLPRTLAETEAAGHRTGPYPGLLDAANPALGMSSWVGEPRYSGGYFPLRHRPSILVEMHSYKPYRKRVEALRDFLAALLTESARGGKELVSAVAEAERRAIDRGRANADPSDIVLVWEQHDTGDTVRWPVYAFEDADSEVMGQPLITYDRGRFQGGDERGIEVPWVHLARPKVKVPRPRGYLVMPGWPQIEERLVAHGLEHRRIENPLSLTAETVRIGQPRYEATPYQGRHRVLEMQVERASEDLEVPTGALWIPADQPDFEVAAQLFEPEASDSLVYWGFLSTVFERKEYIEPRVLESIVQEKLEEPTLRRQWQEALADEELAGNPWARWLWWYRRTPYWDERVGKLPVLRVMTLPPELRRPKTAGSPTSARGKGAFDPGPAGGAADERDTHIAP